MTYKYLFNITMVFIILLIFPAWLDPYAESIKEGNDNYNKNYFESAQKNYKKAEEYAPSEKSKSDMAFNYGDIKYKQGKYDEAIEYYKQSLNSESDDIKKKSFYNMGNAYYKKGDIGSAVNAYINALKVDPGYQKAKMNLEHILSDKKDDKKDKQDQDKDNKNQDKDNKGQDKDKQNNQDKQNQNKDKQNNKQNSNQQNNDQKKDEKIKLTPEQVKNILRQMKNKPVRRQKGKKGNYGEKILENNW